MTTQQSPRDTKCRVVSLASLRAMCRHLSGVCHNYTVSKVTRSRVHVEYSNPDEYGNACPMTAVYPCYPSDQADNPNVVLDLLRVIADNWDGEGWQQFGVLDDCPTLWSGSDDGPMRTHRQIREAGDDKSVVGPCRVCAVCDLKPEVPGA